MSRFGFGYANRQTVDPPVVRTAVLFFLTPMLAGSILWFAVTTVPNAYQLARHFIVYRPVTAMVIGHDHVLRIVAGSPPGIGADLKLWQPRFRLRFQAGGQQFDAWTHEPFSQWVGDSQIATLVEQLAVGSRCRSYYDLTDTRQVILNPNVPLSTVLSIVVPTVALLISGGLMWMAWPLMFHRPRRKRYDSPQD